MTKSYRVAGHVFSFVFPEGHPLWGLIGQYKPFEIPADPSPLFTVELVERLPEETLEKVYGGDEEPGQPVILLYRRNGGWAFEMAPCPGRPVCGRAYVDGTFSHVRLQILRPSEGLFALNNAAMLVFAFSTASLDTLEMHASVVVNSGKAFLWLARSGTAIGKIQRRSFGSGHRTDPPAASLPSGEQIRVLHRRRRRPVVVHAVAGHRRLRPA